MFKRRKMRFNGEWSLLAGNRVYELCYISFAFLLKKYFEIEVTNFFKLFFQKIILVKHCHALTVSVLIEHGADVFATDKKGEGVLYLAKKLTENDPIKYRLVDRAIRHNLRVNYNSNNLKSIQL